MTLSLYVSGLTKLIWYSPGWAQQAHAQTRLGSKSKLTHIATENKGLVRTFMLLYSSHTEPEPTVSHHEATCLVISAMSPAAPKPARRRVNGAEGISDIEGKGRRGDRARGEASEFQIHVSKTISWFLFQFLLRHPVRFDDLPVGSLLSEFCHRNSMLSFSANDQQSIGPAS